MTKRLKIMTHQRREPTKSGAFPLKITVSTRPIISKLNTRIKPCAAVLDHVPVGAQTVDHRQHIRLVAAVAALA